jgi:hypothetical protein
MPGGFGLNTFVSSHAVLAAVATNVIRGIPFNVPAPTTVWCFAALWVPIILAGARFGLEHGIVARGILKLLAVVVLWVYPVT